MAKKAQSTTFIVSSNKKQFEHFLFLLEELNKITRTEKVNDVPSDNSKIKIMEYDGKLYLYSVYAHLGRHPTQFKDVLIEEETSIGFLFPERLSWIIYDPQKMIKGLKTFLRYPKVIIEFIYKDNGDMAIMDLVKFSTEDQKIKVKYGGTHQNNIFNMNPSLLEELYEKQKYLFELTMTPDIQNQIKELSTGMTKADTVYRFEVFDGNIILGDENEEAWSIEIGKTDIKDHILFYIPKNLIEKMRKEKETKIYFYDSLGIIQQKYTRTLFSPEAKPKRTQTI